MIILKKPGKTATGRKSVFWRWTNSEAVWEWFTAMSLPLENYLKNPAADDVQNYPRKPDFIKHGVFFAALPIIVRMSEKSKYVERVDVYSRQGEHLAFLDKNSNLKSELTPLQALRKERRRPWIYLERNKYNRRRQEVEEKMRQQQSRPLGQDDVSLDDVDGQKPEIKFSAGRNKSYKLHLTRGFSCIKLPPVFIEEF